VGGVTVAVNNGDLPAFLVGVQRGEQADCASADDGQSSGRADGVAPQAVDGHCGRVSECRLKWVNADRYRVGVRCWDDHLLGESSGQVPAEPP
jgi:hypothetical protein